MAFFCIYRPTRWRHWPAWTSAQLYGMGCQTARDSAGLSLDQSCCSHVRRIMFLSIPPYPAAHPNTWRVGSLLSLSTAPEGRDGASQYYTSSTATEEIWRLLVWDVFRWIKELKDVLLSACQVRHEANRWDKTKAWTGRSSQQQRSSKEWVTTFLILGDNFSAHLLEQCFLGVRNKKHTSFWWILQQWMFTYMLHISHTLRTDSR